MKYYKSKYEIPLWNWLMIQENSFDLSYLYKKKRELRPKDKIKLTETYYKILETLNNLSSDVLINFIKWKALILAFRAEIELRRNKIIENYEITVREYLESLENHYENFEVKQYYFDENYKDNMLKFKKELDENTYNILMNELKNFEEIEFYTFLQYNVFIKKYPVILAMTINPNFIKENIKSRIIKINSLVALDKFLLPIYEENKLYNEYQFIRWQLFNISDLHSESKNKTSAFDHLEQITQARGIEIDPKKITLHQFEVIEQAAKDKNEKLKQKESGRV